LELLVTAPATIHASAARLGAHGVLIRGAAGSGKSSLLLSLVVGPGDAMLVADDRVIMTADGGRLVAAAPEAIAGRLEVRGVGIVRRPHASPVPIDLVVDLLPLADCPRLPDAAEKQTIIEGISVARIFVAVGAVDGPARVHAALADMYG
jgi:serine kinase of HPr protein (carbohydrate metabolism regulator)